MPSNKPIHMTLFHMEGCYHCDAFEPVWKEMIADKNACKNIKFDSYERVDMEKLPHHAKTINLEKIEGFPTIKISILGKEHNYVGPRTTSEIYSFIVDQLRQSHGLSSPVSVEMTETSAINSEIEKRMQSQQKGGNSKGIFGPRLNNTDLNIEYINTLSDMIRY